MAAVNEHILDGRLGTPTIEFNKLNVPKSTTAPIVPTTENLTKRMNSRRFLVAAVICGFENPRWSIPDQLRSLLVVSNQELLRRVRYLVFVVVGQLVLENPEV